MPVENSKDVGVSYAIERALNHHCLNLITFNRRTALQRVDHCHGRFAFAQIAGHGLAKNALGCGQVEDIIHDLSWAVPAGDAAPVELIDYRSEYVSHLRRILPPDERLKGMAIVVD